MSTQSTPSALARSQSLEEAILWVLDGARYAPSGDNTQPWRFNFEGDRVEVSFDAKRLAHALNNNNHASYLTLGALVETMSLRASVRGLRLEFENRDRFKKSGGTHPIQALLRFYPGDVGVSPLADFIERRVTDRRPFLKEPLDPSSRAEVTQLSQASPGCRVEVIDQLSRSGFDYVALSDSYMWRHKEVLKDLFQWVRLTKQEIENSRDGMPWQNLGIQSFEVPLFSWLRNRPELPGRLWRWGFSIKTNGMIRKSLIQSGGFAAIFINRPDPDQIIEGGRTALRTWLYLTSKGYGVQPLSLCSLTAFDFATGNSPSYALSDYMEPFAAGQAVLRAEFKVKEDGWWPLWMFRYGKPQSSKSIYRTSRLPLVQLMD